MKTITSLFQILIIITAALNAITARADCTPPPAGIVGWWKGDGNTIDCISSNNGFPVNVIYTNGVVGQAFAFNSVDYGPYIGIQVPDRPAYALTNSLTIEGWVRPRGDGWNIFWRGDNRPGLDPYTLMMHHNNTLQFVVTDANGNTAIVTNILAYNQWTHVAATLDGTSGTMSIYTNGVLAAQTVTSVRPFGTLVAGDSPGVGIGNVNDGQNNFGFVGDIDEISLYNRALSSNEIAAIYEAGSSGKCVPAPGNPVLLDINFGAPDTNKVGFAAIGLTANDYWNGYRCKGVTSGPTENLKWSDQSDSGINITVLNAPGEWANNTGDGMYDPFIYPWNGGNVTATLSNVPAGSYDFYLYGHSGQNYENSKFQISIENNTTVWEQTQDSTLASTSTNWIEGVQYVVFRNVSVSSGEPITITCAPGDGGNAIFNGMQMISTNVSGTLPIITSEPQDAYVYAYGPASFSVGATGASTYQWLLNGSFIPNATSSTLDLPSVSQSQLGQYSVLVGNNFGSVTSSIANLYMYPSIQTPFTGIVTDWGQSNTLSVLAWGSGTLTYQWYDNGVAIPGGTNSSLTFSSIQFTNAGSYSVVISSFLGSVTNTPAQVVVNPAGVSLGLYPGVTITGTVGYTYEIQSNPDLGDTNGWTTVATVTLSQPTQLWIDVNNNAVTNQHRYYRVLPGQ